MLTPSPGIELAVHWFDDDFIELGVFASNGRFSAAVVVFVPPDGLAWAAEGLRDFPRSVDDSREVVLGALDDGFRGGTLRLRACCSDSAGHPLIEIWCRTPPDYDHGGSHEATFWIAVEASAIDELVRALQGRPREGAVFRLPASFGVEGENS